MHKFAKSIIAISLVLALIAAAFLFWAKDLITSPFDVEVTQGETTISTTTLSGSLQDIAELSTEEYAFTNVGKFDEQGLRIAKINVPLTSKNFLATYDGTIKAGLDFSQLEINTDDAAHTIIIQAPKPVITQASIDPNSIVVYDQTMNPFNQVQVEDVSEFLSAETETSKTKAIERGLLDRAKTRAEDLITEHIEAMTENTALQEYTVQVNWQD